MVVYLTLLVLAGLGLAVPLCSTLAARATADLVLDRTNDAARFAGLAEQAVVSGAPGIMANELQAYREVYGIDGLIIDREGGVVAGSRPGLSLGEMGGPGWTSEDGLPAGVLAALAGNRVGAEGTLWPWTWGPLVVVEPIGSGGEVVGAVVTASPTAAVHRATLLQWGGVVLGVLLLLAAGISAAAPLTRWVLRPIADLEQATVAISRGSLDTRVPVADGPAELQHLADSFNEMADTITSLMERQRTFVAYAGHQVRNPLAALRLRMEALGEQVQEPHRQAHRMALDEVDRLARTCDSLLTLAQADDAPIETVEVDVGDVVRRRLRGWQPIAERSAATLAGSAQDGLVVRCADGMLDQALDALIDNALKFGGRGVRVAVDAGPVESELVEVRVRDDGPGLPTEQLRRGVEPFWRGEPDGGGRHPALHHAAGGSGLGLSIVVTLLELHGGRLLLEPAQPHGVLARIQLPAG